jgi:hypothetical protein
MSIYLLFIFQVLGPPMLGACDGIIVVPAAAVGGLPCD